jgi:hypothetical protein
MDFWFRNAAFGSDVTLGAKPRQGLSAAVGGELAVEVIDVGLDRTHADEQLGGDPAVGFARGRTRVNKRKEDSGFGKPRRLVDSPGAVF